MINFDSFIYGKSNLPEDYKDQEKFFKELEQSFYEEIINSEKAKKYFEQFNSRDIDSFIKSYVQKKLCLIKNYKYYDYIFRENENYELSFQKKAETALKAIQQKKLFNIQLLWRAYQQQIDAIDICYDFQFWGNHIESCPFIPPVEAHEIDLMKEYLLNSNDYDEEISDQIYPSWQDYNQLMEKDARGLPENMNDWYEFYDGRMGTGVLLILPNLKGEKEDFYMDLSREEQTTTFYTEKEIDKKPFLIGYGENIIEFSKFFESDKYFIQLYKGYEVDYKKESHYPFPENVDYAIHVLSAADRPIHFAPHLNWDEAIISASKKYINTKTAEALDIVFDEYKMLLELGMLSAESSEEIAEAYENDGISKMYRTVILKGRVKNGEPEDFNY